MNLQLSQNSVQLLPAQLRLDGTFQHRVIRRDMALPCAAMESVQLTVSQEPKAVNLTLRRGPFCDSCSIPRTDLRTVVRTAHQWIEGTLNGRLEGAA